MPDYCIYLVGPRRQIVTAPHMERLRDDSDALMRASGMVPILPVLKSGWASGLSATCPQKRALRPANAGSVSPFSEGHAV